MAVGLVDKVNPLKNPIKWEFPKMAGWFDNEGDDDDSGDDDDDHDRKRSLQK